MAFRSDSSPPSGSQTPSSDAASLSRSPIPPGAPLPPPTPPEPAGEASPSTQSARATPVRPPTDLPRLQNANRGGCWTCRLRRKKCDEQRENDSCHTCIRLGIRCLGWGPRRPEWMRDKEAVQQYKADIKAKLIRAGLVRGQPRSSLTHAAGSSRLAAASPHQHQQHPRPRNLRRADTFSANPTSLNHRLGASVDFGFGFAPPHRASSGVMPGPSHGPYNPRLHHASYSDSDLTTLDLNLPPFQLSPQLSASSLPTTTSSISDTFDYSQLEISPDQTSFGFEIPDPAQNVTLLTGQDALQAEHVLYYFENARKMQYPFAGTSITNVTYSLIVEEPRGAVTNAVCALANLHYTRMRIAQGLERPEPNPAVSLSTYVYGEAWFQLTHGEQTMIRYSEGDAIAALHLVSYSMMSGGLTDWKLVLDVALDWLAQTGLTAHENPRLTLNSMSPAAQCAVKITLWYDIFSSLTHARPPKYSSFYKRLFDRGGYWVGSMGNDRFEHNSSLRMETFTGCTDEAMLGIVEVSELAFWKANEIAKGSLSIRELVRRGDLIEQKLRQNSTDPLSFAETDQAPLHPSLSLPIVNDAGHAMSQFPNEDMRRIVANLFREAVILYLQSVLSDSNPGVPEIAASVDVIVQLLKQLPPSEVDRCLVFPICIAGCMSDNSIHRDFLKRRLQGQVESIGNLLQTRLLMEAVWQKRDVNGGSVDWRDVARERNINLLMI